VRLLDRDAGLKDVCLKSHVEQMTFKRRLKTLKESATLTKSGRLLQIVENTKSTRCCKSLHGAVQSISKSELDERSVLAGLYESSNKPDCWWFCVRYVIVATCRLFCAVQATSAVRAIVR